MSEIRQAIEKALANPVLSDSLTRFSQSYRISRARAYEGIEFEEVRSRIAESKRHASEHLEKLASAFTEQARSLGVHVFMARSAREASDYVVMVARQKQARLAVKSKSMASEEIHLNRRLEEAGVEVAETDLGEWIIQLAHQRPSHMVLPAIHLTRDDVAALFSRQTRERLEPDIPRLVGVARRELREKFLTAEIGITGANVAVAETGSLVLLTNEGNARLVTTLPQTHIAIVGLEKLVERMEDALPILTALPRSATGQLITSYVSIITGPVENTDGSRKDLHVVLLDNRRTEMASDPVFREALQCIRCGSCLNVCPVFRAVGGHVFGKVYTGGIGTILTAWFDAFESSRDIQSLCIQCGSCRDFCPGHIDIPNLILELRDRVSTRERAPLLQKAAYALVNNRRAFHAALRVAAHAQKPLAREGFIRHLPFALSSLTKGRSLPAIAAVPFRDRFPKLQQPEAAETAVFYAGCLIDFVYPETGEAVVKVLNRAGIRVVFPEGQGCCGAPARYGGSPEAAAEAASANVAALAAANARYIVSACPTCTAALKREFTPLLRDHGTADEVRMAEFVSGKITDFSTLALELARQGRLNLESAGSGAEAVTYHDSCHLKRTLGVSEAPRELLKHAGVPILEMAEADVCCGMGGSYALKQPAISLAMLRQKLVHIQDTGAMEVATDCPGCVLQIQGGLEAGGLSIVARHTAERLAERLPPTD